MRLEIESIGNKALRALSSRKSAVVEGVFARALYLRFQGDFLIGIGGGEDYIHSSCAHISNFEQGVFKSIGIREGMTARIASAEIVFPEAGNIAIRFDAARVWSRLRAPKLGDLAGALSMGLNLRVLRDVIYTKGGGEGLAPLLLNVELYGPMQFFLNPPNSSSISERARPNIETLMWALYRGDAPAAADMASSILGLGAGLTPSCDDFLCGLIFTLNLGAKVLRRRSEAELYSRFALETCRRARGKTTIYSLNLLDLYRAGEAPKAVSELAYALLTADASRVAAIAKVVMQMGETSGADTAVGIYYGIRFMLAKLEFAQLQQEFNEIA
ncbi:MAG: oxamate carbamoyltransferase subunit AllH family protein [Deltaproteobacteria bacterium]